MKMKYFGLMLLLAATMFLTGCKEDELNSTSVFDFTPSEQNEFDRWLLRNYTDVYNIRFQYRYNDKETDDQYNVIPAEYDKSVAIAKLVRHMWLEVYNEGVSPEFIRSYTPRVIQLIGSNEYSSNGEIVLGTAEGGLKVMLYGVNNLDIDNPYINVDDFYRKHDALPLDLNYWFFHTMHHEFCHILTQKKNYSTDFQTISAGQYHSADWVNVKDDKAAKEGFVSGYASGEYNEDFAETYATYITMSPAGWQKIIDTAGTDGAAIINKKLAMVREYFQGSWGIDIDEVRDIVLRRSSEVATLDLRNLD